MNKDILIGLLVIAVGGLIGNYFIQRGRTSISKESTDKIINNDNKNKEKLLKGHEKINSEINKNIKEIEALKKAVLSNSGNLQKETGFTYEELKVIAKNVIEKSNSNIDKGNAFYVLNEYDKAIDKYSEVIKLNPYNSEVYFNRARARFNKLHNIRISSLLHELYFFPDYRNKVFDLKEVTNEIINDYTKSLELDESSSNAFFNRGYAYNTIGEYQNAIADFENAIKIHPEDASYYNGLGISYSNLTDSTNNIDIYDTAIKQLEKAISLSPNNAIFWHEYGTIFLRKRDHNKAVKYFSKALELDSTYIYSLHSRATLYRYLNKFSESILDYTLLINLGYYKQDSYFYRGQCYFAIKDCPSAINDFSKCIELKKDNINALFSRGVCYAIIEEYILSIKDYNSILKLEESSSTYTNRGNGYLNLKQYNKALEDYNRALEIDPNNLTAKKYKKKTIERLKEKN